MIDWSSVASTSSGIRSSGYDTCIAQSGNTTNSCIHYQMEYGSGGAILGRWYSGSNLLFTVSSSGAIYLGNGSTTGSLFWGATPIVTTTLDSYFHSLTINGNLAMDATRNAYVNSLTDVGTSTLTLDSARNSRVN